MLAAEQVAAQAILGSDKKREELNLMRVLAIRRNPKLDRWTRERWNLLFDYKIKL